MQFFSHTMYFQVLISHLWLPHCRFRTFPSSQKVLIDSAALKSKLQAYIEARNDTPLAAELRRSI